MKYTPSILREVLHSLIRKLEETPEQFVRRPGRDFTRPRTLRFETVISLLLTMSENSVGKAMIERFQNREETPSASAFVQQREKLLPAAMETLFQRFTACLRPAGRFQGYRLLAADGSDLKSAAYPGDPASYRPGIARQHGWNLWHLNALYDLQNGIYTDVIVQKEHEKDEKAALCAMVDRSSVSGPVILLADRGYEACNNLAHLERKGWNYLLDPKCFPPAALKRLYAMRWGIEISFRSLKYAVGLIHLHAKKPDLVLQEIFAGFLIFNFTQASIWTVDTAQGASNQCRVNFSDAVFACCVLSSQSLSPIRSRSFGENCSLSALVEPRQGQKLRATAFPPATPPHAESLFTLFFRRSPLRLVLLSIFPSLNSFCSFLSPLALWRASLRTNLMTLLYLRHIINQY